MTSAAGSGEDRADCKRVEVVLKIAERCNLACRYCYFFESKDRSFESHPPVVSLETMRRVAEFLAQGIADLGIQSLQVDLHGGEPLLAGKRRFAAICEILRGRLGGATKLTLALQTNAVLIDDEWIDIFRANEIFVSTSIDGREVDHDKHRIDKHGLGSYRRVLAGITRLKDAHRAGLIPEIGVLAVIDPALDAASLYKHLCKELELKCLDVLLPDLTHDDAGSATAAPYGRFLCDLFDAWIDDAESNVRIRTISSVLSLLLGGSSRVVGLGRKPLSTFTISSDGSLAADDTLRACGSGVFQSNETVDTVSLATYLTKGLVASIDEQRLHLNSACNSCCWLNVCGGGLLVHRYSTDSGFGNRSVFCDALKVFYAHVAAALINSGTPIVSIEKSLRHAVDTAADGSCDRSVDRSERHGLGAS